MKYQDSQEGKTNVKFVIIGQVGNKIRILFDLKKKCQELNCNLTKRKYDAVKRNINQNSKMLFYDMIRYMI